MKTKHIGAPVLFGIPQEIVDILKDEIIPQAVNIKFINNQYATFTAMGVIAGDGAGMKILKDYYLCEKKNCEKR